MRTTKSHQRISHGTLGLVLSLTASSVTWATATPWLGSADYRSASSSTGDEDLIGTFNTYDFGTGVLLLQDLSPDNGVQQGDVFNGYFQSYVQAHELDATPVSAPGLNLNYELTIVAQFQQTVMNVSPYGQSFQINSGTAALYFDTSPDRNYASDSGFADDDILLSGVITGGNSLFIPSFNFGSSQLTLDLSGIFGSFNSAVYEPDTITGATSNFNLRGTLNDQAFLNSVSSVRGVNKTGNTLLAGDGDLQLTANPQPAPAPIPLPLAGWLFGPGLAGLYLSHRRRRIC